MIGALIFSLVPTAAAYGVLARTGLIRHWLLRCTFAWFLGQYVSTLAVLVLASVLGLVTQQVLLKAAIVWIDLLIALLFLSPQGRDIRRHIPVFTPARLWQALTPGFLTAGLGIAACIAFAGFIFRSHLAYVDGQIFRSDVYWDITIHYPMIQTFVYGDNFPPENESYAGVPMTYHFFFDLLTAIYEALGLELIAAIQFVSIVSLVVMMLTVAGFTLEVFGSSWAAALAVLLCVTTGSLRFPGDIGRWASIGGLPRVISELLDNHDQPYNFGVVRDMGVAYNGNMWNMFYFIAERQMIVAVMYLLFAAWVLIVVDRLPWRAAVGLGVLLALFLQWHLYVTIMVACAIGWLVLWRPRPRGPETALMVSFAFVFALQGLYLKYLMSGPWFLPEIHQYPRLNFEFATLLPEYPGSPLEMIKFYLFGYGLRLAFLGIALLALWRKPSPLFLVFTGVLIPTFILINTVQLSPLSVYDNHKWLKPMNVLVDVAVASGVVLALRRIGRRGTIAAAVPVVMVLTLSGALELIPYLKMAPRALYSAYPTPAMLAIRAQSEPRASFLATEAKMLHLAGRKMYLGNAQDEVGAVSVVETEKFDVGRREGNRLQIYASQSAGDLCQRAAGERIDYVEFKGDQLQTTLFQQLAGFPRIEVQDAKGQPVAFVNVRSGCAP